MFITKDDQISPNQAMVGITTTTLGAGLLVAPRALLQIVDTPDAWISMILGGIVTLLALLIIVKLSQHFPKQTIFQYISKIVGKPIGSILCLAFCIYFLLISGLEVRVLNEVLGFYLLEGTPHWAILMPIMLISYYLLLGGVNALMRLLQIVFPITILFTLIVYSLSFTMFDLENFKPVLSEGFKPVARGILPSVSVFSGYELVGVFIAHLNQPKKAIKSFSLGLIWVIAIYLLGIVLVIGALSVEAGKIGTYSTIDLMRNYELEGFLFERIEILFLVIWVLQLFCTFSGLYYGASLALAEVIKYKKKPIILGLLPVSYIFTMLPHNYMEIMKLGRITGNVMLVMFACIFVLYIITIIKKKVTASA